MKSDETTIRREVARSLDATPELLPFIPELLADLQALGSSPENVCATLQTSGVGRVIDPTECRL